GVIMCGRQSGNVPGFVFLGKARGDDQFSLYRPEGDPALDKDNPRFTNGHSNGHRNRKPIDWEQKAKDYAQRLTPERRAELARILGLPESALAALPIGFLAGNEQYP